MKLCAAVQVIKTAGVLFAKSENTDLIQVCH